MPTKRDPLAAVIKYFTTAPNDELANTLTVVKEIVRSRLPLPPSRKPKVAAPRRPAPVGSATPATLPHSVLGGGA